MQPGTAGRFAETPLPGDDWVAGDKTTLVVEAHRNEVTGLTSHRIEGVVKVSDAGYTVAWDWFAGTTSPPTPAIVGDGLYRSYVGATLTAKAFDSVAPGLGKWLVTIAAWMFALSTMISWSYYGEQALVFLVGEKAVLGYRIVYCGLIIVATLGLVRSVADLDNVIGIGTGVMMFANLPIIWLFGYQAMRAYKEYVGRLKSGRMGPDHSAPALDVLLSGRDIEKR